MADNQNLNQNLKSKNKASEENKNNCNVVKVGCKVKLLFQSGREGIYEIVSFNPDLEKNQISSASPLASAIIGKKEGENVDFFVGENKKSVQIQKIYF